MFISRRFITDVAKNDEFNEFILEKLRSLLQIDTTQTVCLLFYIKFKIFQFFFFNKREKSIENLNDFFLFRFSYDQDPLFLFLDVIAATNRKSALSSIKFLLDTPIIFKRESSISRRSFSILKEKLAQIDGAIESQTELVSYLSEFKANFQHHEM